jgi:hypothetical protein
MARTRDRASSGPDTGPAAGRPGRSRLARVVRRAARLLGFGTGALVIGLVLLLLATWLWWRPEPEPDRRGSQGTNALWLGHTWVGDGHTEAEYAALAARLRRARISDALFHTGPLAADGTVPPARYPHAEALLAALARHAPEIRAQAYLGQVERRAGGPLDLGEAAVRGRIATTADGLLGLGFEGIHFDIEPVYPGDADYLDLLERTRKVTAAHGAVLSVALEELTPFPGPLPGLIDALPGVRRPAQPTPAYLVEVAGRVDQIAIMTYGSLLPTDYLFGRYVAWQTERLAELVADRVTVFVGVPTENHPWRPAETVAAGLRGVRKGLAEVDDERAARIGVAVFADWTTTDAEWADYQRGWVAAG